jgi:Tfp pilus assembly PilM family ATPase
MSAARSLPLGIDIGTTRIRIAQARYENEAPFLARVCVVDLTEDESSVRDACGMSRRLKEAVQELGTREQRCVLALSEAQATLRTVHFPPMSSGERERAGRFEAMRHITYPLEEAFVRCIALSSVQGAYALGIARRAEMQRLLDIARGAGLRPLALDHEAYALQRAFPYADAVLDMGHATARLYAFGQGAPAGLLLDGGADTFTHATARGLSIDIAGAERRKRSIGLGGTGEAEMSAFASSVGRGLLSMRSHGIREIQRLTMVGNGARLIGLAERLERDTGCSIDVASSLNMKDSAYPDDVIKASAPDWALSVSLASWSVREKSTPAR